MQNSKNRIRCIALIKLCSTYTCVILFCKNEKIQPRDYKIYSNLKAVADFDKSWGAVALITLAWLSHMLWRSGPLSSGLHSYKVWWLQSPLKPATTFLNMSCFMMRRVKLWHEFRICLVIVVFAKIALWLF